MYTYIYIYICCAPTGTPPKPTKSGFSLICRRRTPWHTPLCPSRQSRKVIQNTLGTLVWRTCRRTPGIPSKVGPRGLGGHLGHRRQAQHRDVDTDTDTGTQGHMGTGTSRPGDSEAGTTSRDALSLSLYVIYTYVRFRWFSQGGTPRGAPYIYIYI